VSIRISLIIPCLNSEQFISACLNSIVSQAEWLYEAIVVDGGSSDSTLRIVNSFIDSSDKIKLLYGPDRGQVDAMNKGMAACTGDVITFVNSDDWLYEGCLKTVVNEFERDPNLDILFGGLTCYQHGTFSIATSMPSIEFLIDYRSFRWPLNPVAYFCRRSIYKNFGSFPDSITVAMDYNFLLSVLISRPQFKLLPVLFGCFRLHGLNRSHTSADVIPQIKCCRRILVFRSLDPYLLLLWTFAILREQTVYFNPRLSGSLSRIRRLL